MSDNRFNFVAILDSIPDGEFNTAKRLHEDLEVCAAAFAPTPGLIYVRIENESSLFNCIERLREQTEQRQAFPLLHIECHGYEDGLQLADNSLVPWVRLKDALTPLNIAMRLNLMVILASCFGGAFTKALSPSDRAPLWGLIGPTQEVSAGNLGTHFSAFYKELFSGGSPKAAVDALNAVSDAGLYWRVTAEGFFYGVWKRYKEQKCTPKQLKMRSRRMRVRANELNVVPLLSESEYEQKLIRQEPESFDKFRDHYFMYDMFPEHRERFSITYENAEAQIDKYNVDGSLP